jgi:ABC-type bacteriocin/lantibiotic exporter with double-glycine peptidase domain
MGSFQGRQSAGAPGGYWEVFDEQSDSRVVRQLTGTSCGPACAEMLFKSRGIADILQEKIIKAQGNEWSFPDSLAAAMNQLQRESGTGQAGKWEGAWVDTFRSPRSTFDRLTNRGPFITSLKSFGSESHMVVIDGIDDRDRIVVRDPWEGTGYAMEWATFESVWQGMSVWWSERSQA